MRVSLRNRFDETDWQSTWSRFKVTRLDVRVTFYRNRLEPLESDLNRCKPTETVPSKRRKISRNENRLEPVETDCKYKRLDHLKHSLWRLVGWRRWVVARRESSLSNREPAPTAVRPVKKKNSLPTPSISGQPKAANKQHPTLSMNRDAVDAAQVTGHEKKKKKKEPALTNIPNKNVLTKWSNYIINQIKKKKGNSIPAEKSDTLY